MPGTRAIDKAAPQPGNEQKTKALLLRGTSPGGALPDLPAKPLEIIGPARKK